MLIDPRFLERLRSRRRLRELHDGRRIEHLREILGDGKLGKWRLFFLQFRRQANALAARYGAPVYLVGGALEDESPRDYDVRVILTDTDLRRLYGVVDPRAHSADRSADWEDWEYLRARDNLKQSRLLSRRYRRNVDFQVQALHEADDYRRSPRLRLDGMPDEFFDAGL